MEGSRRVSVSSLAHQARGPSIPKIPRNQESSSPFSTKFFLLKSYSKPQNPWPFPLDGKEGLGQSPSSTQGTTFLSGAQGSPLPKKGSLTPAVFSQLRSPGGSTLSPRGPCSCFQGCLQRVGQDRNPSGWRWMERWTPLKAALTLLCGVQGGMHHQWQSAKPKLGVRAAQRPMIDRPPGLRIPMLLTTPFMCHEAPGGPSLASQSRGSEEPEPGA